ncbi:MAG: type II secretion system F family protein [Candidatus Gracilibacteria bacterium]|nr:type II secretion system F family protein [Candidatus Gracilibacteria bacterium]
MADFLIMDDDKNSGNDNNVHNDKSSIKTMSFIDQLNDFIVSLQSVKTKEKVVFYRLLSTMTNAGMTLIKAILVLEKQEKNTIFKAILLRFGDELKQGKNLSECLEMYPSSFSEAEIGIIKSGEKTGQLNLVLSDLSSQIEKVESLTGKIKSAMMYPMFIIIVVIGVVAVMMTMIVPKLLDIFDDKSTLPSSTKALMALSNIFQSYWFLMIIIAIIAFVAISIWKKTPDGKYIFDNILLKIPVFGLINKKLVLSKFARTFSGLSSSGVSVVESLKITSSAVGNEVYKQRILLLSEDISSGIKMWESLDGDKLFPDMMVQMIQVGEETAKLDKIILKVADFYDDEVDNTITVLNKLLEPFIIVTLAIIVGFIALAIMQPIMNLADTVSQG